MKSLYESILDDEDVLVGGLKNDINNPFILLYSLYKNYNQNLLKVPKQEIKNILEKIGFPGINELELEVYRGCVNLILPPNKHSSHYIQQKDVVGFLSFDKESVIKLFFNQRKTSIIKWLESQVDFKEYKHNLVKKFNMEKNSKSMYYYYI